jgi:hypothetical protein
MNKHTILYSKAQAMLEYLLVMVVVVMIVFVAFKAGGGGVLQKTHDKVNAYFDTGTTAIMGGYWDEKSNTFIRVEPSPIDGDWCAWTTCVAGYKSRECACPRPAFGGKACDGNSKNAKGSGEAVLSCTK